jgi:hypothetical protein
MRYGATHRGFESRPLRHPSGTRTCQIAITFVVVTDSDGCRHVAPARRAWTLPHSHWTSMLRMPNTILIGYLARTGHAATLADPTTGQATALYGASGVDFRGRARRGTSGALYLQSAPAGLNPLPRSPLSKANALSDVEGLVPRSGDSRTVSGPEGSSTKRTSSGAAERPGPSRSWWWARERPDRRWVHGKLFPPRRSGVT